MRARFFLPGISRTGQIVSLTGEELYHLRTVLRLGPGEEIGLFDGEGRSFTGKILDLTGREARVVLDSEERTPRESGLRLVLLAALSKGEKFEWVVQKATELGVSEILPLLSRRGDVRPVAGREGRKAERWRRVALEACKQSGRSRIPGIHDPETLESALSRPWREARFVLDPEGSEAWEALSPARLRAEGLLVAVGPEGGWSPEEKKSFRERGFTALRLGPRTLRTETAAIVATAVFQLLAGDLVSGGKGLPPSQGDNALKTKV